MQSVMTLYWKERRSGVPRSILRMQMDNKLMLPTGIEDFKEIRTDGYYYVDKTALIEQVLDKRSKVTLFTRPRRFGKTLNMSMLRYFFETGTDSKWALYFTKCRAVRKIYGKISCDCNQFKRRGCRFLYESKSTDYQNN